MNSVTASLSSIGGALSRPMYLLGTGVYAVIYCVVRAMLLFGVVALFFDLEMPDAISCRLSSCSASPRSPSPTSG
jgi:hypothetical protein